MKNGYKKSILKTEDGECFLCGVTGDTARHEIYFGANRANSKKHGFWIAVCPNCHQYGNHAVHKNIDTDLYLKRLCQEEFEKHNSREEFMKIIGKNYL